MSDLDTAIQHYVDLMIFQYQQSPKAVATIELLSQVALADLVTNQIDAAFDLATAEGTQLDVLGEYIGQSRTLVAQIDRNYFRMVDYQAPMTESGFTDYLTPVNAGNTFYLYVFANVAFYTLNDSEYRPLLQLKGALNTSHNSKYEIDNLLWGFFGNTILCFDGADMTITYLVTPDVSHVVKIAIQIGLLPKPTGVLISGIFQIVNPQLLFGFQDYGYDTGNYISFSDYSTGWVGYWLTYSDRIA